MRGLTIARTHEGPAPRRANGVDSRHVPLDSSAPVLELLQLTDFVEFFSSAFERIRRYHWLLDDVVFAPPQEWDEWYEPDTDRQRGALHALGAVFAEQLFAVLKQKLESNADEYEAGLRRLTAASWREWGDDE